jgi:hypothetical protein
MKDAQRYETCIAAYNMLLEINQSRRAYAKLTSNFNDLKQVCARLVERYVG